MVTLQILHSKILYLTSDLHNDEILQIDNLKCNTSNDLYGIPVSLAGP